MAATPQKTLLQIIRAAQGELGLPLAATVIDNTDATTMQLLALLNAAGEEMRDQPEDGWTAQQIQFNLVVSPPIVTTGNTGLNSAVLTNIPDTTGLDTNYVVQGANIPVDARVKSVDSINQITMDMEATAAVSNTPLTFSKDTYSVPDDFHFFIGDTWWDRTNRWKLMGPDSPRLDQWHRSGIVTTGPRRHFRVVGRPAGNTYRIWPPPAEIVNPLQLEYEYQSLDWVNLNGDGVDYANAFENDDDIPTLNDRALIMSVKWRFWQIKGFAWLNMQSAYLDYVDKLIATDGGTKTISIVRRYSPGYLTSFQVQDGFFPGPGNPGS